MKTTQITVSVILAICSFIGEINSASITVQPSNQTVKLGDTASFYCGVTGTQGVGETHAYRKLTPTNSLVALDASPTNTTKHNITDRYRLHIFDVAISDEGMYECELFPTKLAYTMSLTVVDPPETTTLGWGGNSISAPAGVPANLTCSVPRSRPPATFRWARGAVDVTSQSVTTQGGSDAWGYGSSESIMELTVTHADVGTVYTCYVDLADMQNVTVVKLPVQLSGASNIQATLAISMAVLMTLFKVL